MTTYVDVETSPEALQEDEELIEAVNELVGAVSETVKNEIESEVNNLFQKLYWLIDRVFPILIVYQEDPRRMTDDLKKVGLFLSLLLAVIWLLAPKKRRRKDSIISPTRKSRILRSVSTSNMFNAGYTNSETEEESDSERVLFYGDSDETDEERFEKLWPEIESSARYRRLVLPPTCRYVRGKALKETTPKASNQQQRKVIEEDPADRLQYYVSQLWYFVRSLISYDYTGAGKTLIQWLVNLRRIQHNSRNNDLDNDNDHNTDDDLTTAENASIDGAITQQAEAVNISDSPVVGNKSCADDSTENNSSSQTNTVALHSPIDGKVDSLVGPLQQTTPVKTTADAAVESTAETSSAAATFHSPLHATPPRPPNLPFIKTDRHQSDDTMYFDPSSSTSDVTNPDASLVSRVASKILLRQRPMRPQQRRKSGRQTKGDDRLLFHKNEMRPLSESSTTLNEQQDQPVVGSLPRSPSKGSVSNFFDTANSRDSLKKMSIDVPVPDKNGYIVGDEFLPDSNRCTPLLVFVNSRSGPQQGHLLMGQLRRLLNPIQIWDLANGGPQRVLESFLVFSRLRILVCGGDGTVSWIVNTLDEMNISRKHFPPIAILPLGTGNDLARIHGWGGGYNNESLITILEQISESYTSLLDRWEVTIHDKKNKKQETKSFFNYLGVGADAQAALQVHYLRESRPQWFFSRMVNQAMYGLFGAEDIIKASNVNVRKAIKLIADGVEVPLPPDSQGIILLNIDSYAGGVPLWTHGIKQNFPAVPFQSPRRTRSLTEMECAPQIRMESLDRIDSVDDLHHLMSEEERFAHVTACNMPSSCQDGYLDVVSIRGAFHLGQIKVGLSNAQRLCQCREATITIKNKVAVQVDGEPWRQKASTLTIKRKKEPAVMLHRSADDGGVEMEMSKLLDWAEERNMIDGQVHSILMKEFSRRIESKTRQRRVKEQDNIMSTLKKALSSGAMANLSSSQHGNTWPRGSGIGGGIAF